MRATKWMAALALVLSLVWPARLRAHGGHDHVMGTVKTVDAAAGRLEVETKDGKVVSIKLTDKTRYFKGKEGASAADLVAGMRVVVDAGREGGQTVAKEIRLGATPKEAGKK